MRQWTLSQRLLLCDKATRLGARPSRSAAHRLCAKASTVPVEKESIIKEQFKNGAAFSPIVVVHEVDMVQLHWWDYDTPGLLDTMLALADLQAEGLIKSLGVTNLNTAAIEKLTDADVQLVSNQVQFSLLDRRPLGPNGMVQLCKERGMKLLCYGVVGGSLLTDLHLEAGHNPLYGQSKYRLLDLSTSSLKLYWNMVQRFGGEGMWRRLLHVLRDVADKHDSGVANVATRWVMSQGGGGLAFPIIGARNANHIASNKASLELKLDGEDLDYIDECLKRSKPLQGDIYSFERQ